MARRAFVRILIFGLFALDTRRFAFAELDAGAMFVISVREGQNHIELVWFVNKAQHFQTSTLRQPRNAFAPAGAGCGTRTRDLLITNW